ncbi:MAG: proline hydroxylase [Bacteroidetes bacterium HGW-Bacteroidetes-12]|nr:MAG: proline hydroxylase [Bacteroidetes bacterium HGW-Bacteroidetes-12]
MQNSINSIYLTQEKIEQLKQDFNSAKPCKYVVLPNFLTDELATTLYENFPKIDTLNVKRKSINENKSEDYHFERFHPAFSELKKVVGSPEMYLFIEKITGIKGLKTTDDSLGSGVHQGKDGSYVDVHIDVNYNPAQNLWRRINLLIYLNKNWKPEYGGNLELWDKKMTQCEAKVPCDFNRAVIFLTDENSPHGYSKITIPEGETRKSFYTYYFTEVGEGFNYSDSRFVSRPDDSAVKKMATSIKEPLKITIKKMLNKLGVKSLDFQDKNKKK